MTTYVKKQMHWGKSLVISNNEIRVDEDLLIDGFINASRIDAGNKTIVVGLTAEVTGDIYAAVVQVIGKVTGNIYASELIAVTDTAIMSGDIAAPKIELAKRCRFQGRLSYT